MYEKIFKTYVKNVRKLCEWGTLMVHISNLRGSLLLSWEQTISSLSKKRKATADKIVIVLYFIIFVYFCSISQ
jgi:hypothetical protein